MSNLSQVQVEKLEAAWDLLSEHFDHVVLGISTEVEQPNQENADATKFYWKGGFVGAIGLFALGQVRAENQPGEAPTAEPT